MESIEIKTEGSTYTWNSDTTHLLEHDDEHGGGQAASVATLGAAIERIRVWTGLDEEWNVTYHY